MASGSHLKMPGADDVTMEATTAGCLDRCPASPGEPGIRRLGLWSNYQRSTVSMVPVLVGLAQWLLLVSATIAIAGVDESS